jgi:hypothetical protein
MINLEKMPAAKNIMITPRPKVPSGFSRINLLSKSMKKPGRLSSTRFAGAALLFFVVII